MTITTNADKNNFVMLYAMIFTHFSGSTKIMIPSLQLLGK